MAKTISSEKARQGGWGRPVLMVLVGGLLLAFIVWAGVELYGGAIEQPATERQPGAIQN